MRFCFYYDHKDLKGGATTLLLTLIKELHHQHTEIVLINFSGGLLEKELAKAGVAIKIIDIASTPWREIGEQIKNDDVLVLTKFDEPFRHLFNNDPRVIIYDINDFITNISDYKYGIKFKGLGKKLIAKLLKKNSLVFMDDTGVFNLKNNFSTIVESPVFLPIPVNVPAKNHYLLREQPITRKLRITYIGRSVDWKMMPLKKILDDLAQTILGMDIEMNIVVDNIATFEKFIKINDYLPATQLSITVKENLAPSAIDEFLLKNSDVHFAMGTAALDAGKFGIPTILMDYSVKDFPKDYKYKWLFETKDFSLGRNLDKIKPGDGMSMDQLLALIKNNGILHLLSGQVYDYTARNHAAPAIADKLKTVAGKAAFRMKDARWLVPYFYRLHTFARAVSRLYKK